MLHLDTNDTNDDAADTLRFRPILDADVPLDPDATSIYDLRPAPPPRYVGRSAARRRQIRATRQDIAGLRDAIDAGWDVGPELAHEERRLAALVTADRR
jgi:hypothetical protein